MKTENFVIVLTGTMPDIIKMAPVVWEGDKRSGYKVLIAHSGQHNNADLAWNQFRSIGLREPDLLLNGFSELPAYLDYVNPSLVLVHGDTNTAREGALAAHLKGYAVGHIEAGLRTYSREPWPEQSNTRIVDACSDIYFAATQRNARSLIAEGFNPGSIFITGNTVVDMVCRLVDKADPKKNTVWACVHREENMRHSDRMADIIQFLNWLAKSRGYDVHFVDRQRTETITLDSRIIRHRPIPYAESLKFMSTCQYIITDSGSIQEESCTLGIPTLTVRAVTDRPESVDAGINIIGGYTFDSLVDGFYKLLNITPIPSNVYGDGNAAGKIWDAIETRNHKYIRWTDGVR